MALTASAITRGIADFFADYAGSISAWVYTETVSTTTTQHTIKYVFGFKQTSSYSDTQRFRAWIDGSLEYDDTFTNDKGADEWQFYQVNKTYSRPAYGSAAGNHTARCYVGDTAGAGTIFDGPASDTGHQNTDTNVSPKAGTVLGAPTGVYWHSATSTTLRFDWTAPASAGIGPAPDNYRVQLATDPGMTGLVVNGYVGNVGSWTATGLTRATNYYFRVLAHNAEGDGSYSGVVGGTTSATVPDTMAAPTVGTPTTAGFTASFVAPNNGGSAITSYEIQVSKDDFATVAATFTGVASSPKVLTGLDPGVKYKAQVRALNAVGAGAWSASSAEIQTLGGVKVWNGTGWTEGIVRQCVSTGPAVWQVVIVRKWNGSSWVV